MTHSRPVTSAPPAADIGLEGHIVEVDPAAVRSGHDALGPQDGAVFAAVQRGEGRGDLLFGELARGLHAPGGEHLVGVVMMMVMVVVMAVAVVVIMVVMLVIMVMVVMMFVLVLVIVVMMVLMIVVMMMVVAGAFGIVALLVLLQLLMEQLGHHVVLVGLHGLEDLLAGDLVPGGGDDDGVAVVRAQLFHRGGHLLLAHILGAGEDDGVGVLDLVVEELAEVLHVHFALGGVGHGDEAVEGHGRFLRRALHGADHVAQLAHARGLDDDPGRGGTARSRRAGPGRSRPPGSSKYIRSSFR